jgi:hypothetical protein
LQDVHALLPATAISFEPARGTTPDGMHSIHFGAAAFAEHPVGFGCAAHGRQSRGVGRFGRFQHGGIIETEVGIQKTECLYSCQEWVF